MVEGLDVSAGDTRAVGVSEPVSPTAEIDAELTSEGKIRQRIEAPTLGSLLLSLIAETRQASISRALGVLSDIRVSFTAAQPVTISSGTVTTVTTTTTVGTVTNQAQVGGFGANSAVSSWNNATVALCNTANITITP